jgi:tetratricopeptide (TPR) repeat protein
LKEEWCAMNFASLWSRRGLGRRRSLVLSFLFTALTGAPVLADRPDPRVGSGVVMKSWETRLRIGAQTSPGRLPHHVFRVERAEGDWLWVVAPLWRGWVRGDEVVPVDRAMAFFDSEILAHPGDWGHYLRRAHLLLEKGELDKARADFDEAIRLAPYYSVCYRDRAQYWLDRQEYDRAIADCDEAIRIDPKYANAYYTRAKVSLARRDFGRAIADCDEAIGFGNFPSAGLALRALVRMESNDLDRALLDTSEAVRIDPENEFAFRLRGAIRLGRGEYDLAIADCDEALRIDPRDPFAFNNRGWARLLKKQDQAAIADFDEAIRLRPNLAIALKNRAQAREAEGRCDLAIADEAALLKIEPDNISALSSHAWHLATHSDAALRDGKTAVAEATQACELEKWRCAGCLEILAAAKAEVGEFDDAVRFEEKAIELRTNDPAAKSQGEAWLSRYRAKKPCRIALKP